MKHKKLFVIPYLAGLILSVAGASAYADLTISEVVGNFNSMNGGQGFTFSDTYPGKDDYVQLRSSNGERVDTSAYHSSAWSDPFTSEFWFYTFAVDSRVPPYAPVSGTATLNYDPTTGYTNAIHIGVWGEKIFTPLNFGAAYLYKWFASTNFDASDSHELKQAFLDLMGPRANLENTGIHNPYVELLLRINSDLDFWCQAYDVRDPNRLMDGFMEGYAVFVVNTLPNNGGQGTNYLYLAKVLSESVDDVPEPATLVFWAFG